MESNYNNLISVEIPNYSGPLETLLDLARNQKVDLTKISVTILADHFLEFIKKYEDKNLDLAFEYLLMATWLAYLKSKLLLPEDDEDDFKDISPDPDPGTFTIIHAGTVGFDRLPNAFIDQINLLVKQLPDQKIEVLFYGPVDYELKEQVHQLGLEKVVLFKGNIERKAMLKKLMECDLQLLLLNKADNAMGRLPGKLYEYLRVKKPIMGLGLPGSDADHILQNTGTGKVLNYNDTEGIRLFLSDLLNEEWKSFNPDGIEQFSSENQISKISDLLKEMIQNG